MGFEQVRLADVKIEKPSPVPAGDYTFQLLPGAAYRVNKFNGIQELNVQAAVAEGDSSGRRVFFNYPDPTAVSAKNGKPMTWSAQALKKLELALGTDSLPGEDPATYLNRVALNGAARFGATLAPSNYVKEGETEPKVEFQLFSVRPAA